MNKKTPGSSGLAVAGLALGIIAIVLSGIPIINNIAFVLGLLALIFGIVVLAKSKNAGKGKAITAIVLGALSMIVVLTAQAFYGSILNQATDSLEQTSAELQSTADKATGDATEELLANDVSIEIGSFTATHDEYGVMSTEVPVTVTNKNSQNKSYSVQIEAVDSAGKRVAEETIFANELGTGQSQSFKAFQYVAMENMEAMKLATFKVVSVSQY